MITGFNSHEKYGAQSFHIQTEDRGEKAARIDTIIYRRGGAVVHRKKISYKDILKCDNLEEIIQELMRDIHEKTLNEVRKGLWTKNKSTVPEYSFKETVMKYLKESGIATGLMDK